MTLSGALASLMNEAITYEALTGFAGASQVRTYAASKTVLGRVEAYGKLVRDNNAREVLSGTRLLLRPLASDGSAYTPKVGDRLTLPAGYDPQQPPIISVRRENDQTGLHHFEVYL